MTLTTNEQGLVEAARILCNGGVVIIPTDTVYGLAAHPDHPEAVQRLIALKHRDAAKPIALLAADTASILATGAYLPPATQRYTSAWPGALTLVLPMPDGHTEGFRVPDHAWVCDLLRRCGGLLRVSSANLSGAMPACSAVETLADIGLEADLVIDGGISTGGIASTVIAVYPTTDGDAAFSLLRAGPIPF